MKLMPHNQKAVDSITRAYETGAHRVIYTSGVGTGKSFVFLGMAEKVEGRILYVIPKYAVKENIENYREFHSINDRVDFVTFNQFSNMSNAENLLADHNFVVIDECHHLGSDLYGRVLLDAMEKETQRKYLGLTATPVRYQLQTTLPNGTTEKNVDVARFFDSRVSGISTFDAIRMGLMPPFQYRIMVPEKDPKQVEKEYGHEYKAVVDYEDNDAVLADIVQTYPKNKWIVFFPSVKELKKNQRKMENLFPGYQIFHLYSDLRNLRQVMDGVAHAEHAVILSVNMLLEGVHMSGITGIILYRNVTTVSTFQQMLGRVCSIGNTEQPLVVDCSCCGPKLFRKLIADSQQADSAIAAAAGAGKPIMSIGIGSHRKWESIDEFLKRTASDAGSIPILSKDSIRAVLSDYFLFGGSASSSVDKLTKTDKDILSACCWKHQVDLQVFLRQVHRLVLSDDAA